MHRRRAGFGCIVATAVVLGLAAGAAGQELTLKPLGDSHVRSLDSALLLTCDVINAVENTNYNIRWFSANGKEITNPTGSRRYVEEESPSMKKLYITKITNEDGGKYTCSATINGQQQQKSVQLDIYKEITFNNVPSPQHPKIYTDALIQCAVSGIPSPEVTWRYGGKKIQFTTPGRFSLVAGQGMKIANITTADNGNYTCRAEVDADGRYDERTITVEVHIPPKMTDDQLKVEGIEGSEARISCKASGLPEPQYQFYKDGSSTPVVASDSIKVDEVAGLVKFEPLMKKDEGKYSCRAYNDVGNDTASGHVKVLVKPLIFDLNSVTEKEGSTVTLTCQSHGDPVPTMTYHRTGGQPIKTGHNGRETVTSDNKGKLQLTIKNLEPSDAGNYTCRAENHLGHHEMTSHIVVQYKPRFSTNHSRTAYAWAGSSRNITCHADGHPAPRLEWVVRDRVLANNDTYHIYDLGSTSHLLVKVRDIDQAWIYSTFICQATNQFGQEKLSIDLKRASVPGRPASVNVTKTMPTMLVLDVHGPEEDGGVPVVGYRVEYDSRMKFDIATDGKIRIENLKPSTNYSISVRAKNDVGVGEPRQLHVTTEDIRKPYPLVITSPVRGTTPFSYKITWQHPDNGGKPITQYEIRIRQVAKKEVNGSDVFEPVTPGWTTIERADDAEAPLIDFQLTGLLELTSYEMEIRMKNEIGWSEVNEKFIFTTSQATPEDLALASSMSLLSVGVVVAIAIVILIIILVVVDVSCYFINSCGVTMILCGKLCGQTTSFSKEKAAEEGESKEALTKGPQPQETATAAPEEAAADGTKEPNEAPTSDDIDKKPLLIEEDEKKPEDTKSDCEKPEETKEADQQDIKEPEKVADEEGTGAAETG